MSQPLTLFLVFIAACITLGPVAWLWVSTRKTATSKRQAHRTVGMLLLACIATIAWQTDAPPIAMAALLIVAAYEIWKARVCGTCLHVAKKQWLLATQHCAKCGAKLEPASPDVHPEPVAFRSGIRGPRGGSDVR